MRESVSTGFGMSIDFTHNCLQGNWLLHDCDSGVLTHSVIRIVQFLGAIASLLSNQEKTNHFWKYHQLHYDLMTWWPMRGLDYIMTNERTWLPMRVLDDLMTYDVWTIWNIWKMAANRNGDRICWPLLVLLETMLLQSLLRFEMNLPRSLTILYRKSSFLLPILCFKS